MANRVTHELGGTSIDDVDVLIALCHEGSGVGATALKELGVPLSDLRVRLEHDNVRGPASSDQSKKLPQTMSFKRMIEAAIIISRELNHQYVGTEHMLLGMLSDSASA